MNRALHFYNQALYNGSDGGVGFDPEYGLLLLCVCVGFVCFFGLSQPLLFIAFSSAAEIPTYCTFYARRLCVYLFRFWLFDL